MVESAEYNALYHPNLSESHLIINADPAWTAAGGRATAGAGVKIGIIDTGIDETHPFFDPTGFSFPPDGGPWPKCDALNSDSGHPDEDCRYVSEKVIVSKVFYNKARNRGSRCASHPGSRIACCRGLRPEFYPSEMPS